MKETILVFPSSTLDSIKFAYSNRDKYNLVGASSDPTRTNAYAFKKWHYLPYINEKNFIDELNVLLRMYNIKKIFVGSGSVWYFLKNYIDENVLNVCLINSPKYENTVDYAKYFEFYSTELYNYYSKIYKNQKKSSYIEFASMLHNYHNIPGQSGDNKFLALCLTATKIPKGDIVEIGTQQGKSAFLLLALAKVHSLGKVLCIDPWLSFAQQDSPKLLQDIGRNFEVDYLFYNFLLNLSLHKNEINYIRKTSDDAFLDYSNNSKIVSPEFGETIFEQRISLLHIDGNHDYTYVYNDLKNYSKLLVDDAWIIVDDYAWAYGDGPKKVGDMFLEQNSSNTKECFYSDGALFIQINNSKKLCFT